MSWEQSFCLLLRSIFRQIHLHLKHYQQACRSSSGEWTYSQSSFAHFWRARSVSNGHHWKVIWELTALYNLKRNARHWHLYIKPRSLNLSHTIRATIGNFKTQWNLPKISFRFRLLPPSFILYNQPWRISIVVKTLQRNLVSEFVTKQPKTAGSLCQSHPLDHYK